MPYGTSWNWHIYLQVILKPFLNVKFKDEVRRDFSLFIHLEEKNKIKNNRAQIISKVLYLLLIKNERKLKTIKMENKK